ncbi:MAG: hypothetical protein HY352_03065 [Candidatus Omnitrophica bacterium]|nr:hypothetical protein [Candidatus Omnitrophota bacterium]
MLSAVCCLLSAGCGYSARPGLPSNYKTVYIKPFANKIDVTRLTSGTEQYPIYRHRMEVDLTNAVINRFQFTGLMRPSSQDRADTRLEGELVEFRRDALRYNAQQQVEEWRLNVVVNLRFIDQSNNAIIWEEERLTGDTSYFASGNNVTVETESQALDRALTDLARRIVERTVENW